MILCVAAHEFVKNLLQTMPRNYFEIGVFDGDNVGKLSQQFPHVEFYGCDPFIEDGCTTHLTQQPKGTDITNQRDSAINNFNRPNAHLIMELSQDYADMESDQALKDMNIGYVLIDGDHSYEAAAQDSELAMRLICGASPVIIWDDVNLADSVGRACAEWQTKYADQIVECIDIYPNEPGHILAFIMRDQDE